MRRGTSHKDTMRVGLVGTGLLGNAVGTRLLDSGFELTVYNRTTAKTKELGARGARIAATPKETAEHSDLILTIVKDAAAVRDVSFGRNGITAGKHAGLCVADMSTIGPFESRRISARFARHGIKKLDVPVMGGPNVAVSGDLVVMCSGDETTFKESNTVLDAIGRAVFYLGPRGAAHSVKLAMNLQITLLALALSEGMVLVEKSGVQPEEFLKVLNSTYFKTGMSQNKAYKMIRGKYEPTFTLGNLKKDISIMAATAKGLGLELPMIRKAEAVYLKAAKNGFADIDYTGIIAYIKKLNGMK